MKPRDRLIAQAACAESLTTRNAAQGARIRKLAGKVADAATKKADELRPEVLSGLDDGKVAEYTRLLRGRYVARHVAGDDE